MLGWLGLGRASSAPSQVRSLTARNYSIQRIARNRLIIVDAERAAAVSAALREHVTDPRDLDVPHFTDPKNQNGMFWYVLKKGHEESADEKVRIAAGDPGTPAEEKLLRGGGLRAPMPIPLASRIVVVGTYLFSFSSVGDVKKDARILGSAEALGVDIADPSPYAVDKSYTFEVKFDPSGISYDDFVEEFASIVFKETDGKMIAHHDRSERRRS